MEIEGTKFGSITIDRKTYQHDVVIRLSGEVIKRKKKLSKKYYGTSHVLSKDEAKFVFEKGCEQLIIGSGQAVGIDKFGPCRTINSTACEKGIRRDALCCLIGTRDNDGGDGGDGDDDDGPAVRRGRKRQRRDGGDGDDGDRSQLGRFACHRSVPDVDRRSLVKARHSGLGRGGLDSWRLAGVPARPPAPPGQRSSS